MGFCVCVWGGGGGGVKIYHKITLSYKEAFYDRSMVYASYGTTKFRQANQDDKIVEESDPSVHIMRRKKYDIPCLPSSTHTTRYNERGESDH